MCWVQYVCQAAMSRLERNLKEKWKKLSESLDGHRVFPHSVSMQNGIEIIEVRNLKSINSVTVIYVKNGKRDIVFGNSEADAIANIEKVEKLLAEKLNQVTDFAPMPKRSNSGSYFRNNNGMMVEVWKKSEKNLDRKEFLPYLNTMTNDFANISAENNLNDMITMSIEEINEANAWFDARNEATVTEMENDEIPMSFW